MTFAGIVTMILSISTVWGLMIACLIRLCKEDTDRVE